MIDDDTGSPLEEMLEKIKAKGLFCVIWTTHSHGKDTTAVNEDKLHEWMTKNDRTGKPTAADVVAYLMKEKGTRTEVFVDAKLEDRTHIEGGVHYVLRHQPMARRRIMFRLAKRYVFADRGLRHSEAIADWAARYAAVAESIGLAFDDTCKDPSRLMYTPRAPIGARIGDGPLDHSVVIVGGKALDLDAVAVPAKPVAAKRPVGRPKGSGKKGKTATLGDSFATENLLKFLAHGGASFDPVKWIDDTAPDDILAREGGKAKIRCPNTGAHSNPGDDTGFWIEAGEGREAGFQAQCSHNTCKAQCQGPEGKGDRAFFLDLLCVKHGVADAEELLQWCSPEAREAWDAATPAIAVAQARDRLTARFKWVLEAGGFYDMSARKMRGVKEVEKEIYNDLPIVDFTITSGQPIRAKWQEVMLTTPASKYDRQTYRPDQPAEYVDAEGQRCLNTYVATTLVPKAGDASLWLRHVDFLFGDRIKERDHYLDALAYKVQKPWAKIRHALVIGGAPGIGKGTVARPLKAIFGARNYVEPDNQEIVQGKRGWLVEKLCAVNNELRMPGTKRSDVVSYMKPVIADDTVRVRLLYLNEYDIDSLAIIVCFTNYPEELYIEPGDRRWWLFKSPAKAFSPDQDKERRAYFDPLHKWLDGEGPAIVYHWLLQRDVSHFDANMAAPWTVEKEHAAENSRGEIDGKLAQHFTDRTGPFCTDVANLDHMLDRFRAEGGACVKCNPSILRNFLRSKGATTLEDCGTRYTTPSGRSGKLRLWVLRGIPDDWRGEYMGVGAVERIGAELERGLWFYAEGEDEDKRPPGSRTVTVTYKS